MAVKEKEETPDPRETEWHPRRRHTLFGHDEAVSRLIAAHQSGKLHHGWLFSGPKGIGKATLAYRFARFLLSHPGGDAATLEIAPDAAAMRRVAALSHPDLFVLQKPWISKDKRFKSEIVVEDARQAIDFFHRTAGEGGYRVCIVDAADDLERASANALLKTLEEPPPRSLIILVSHRPAGLLPTIQSRCIRLALTPPGEAAVRAIVNEVAADEELDKREAVIALSEGSPGRALELIGARGALAFQRFAEMVRGRRVEPAQKLQIAAQFAGRGTAEDFDTFARLLLEWAAAEARALAFDGGGAALASAHEDIGEAIRLTTAYNLDRRQAAIEAMTRVEEALRTG